MEKIPFGIPENKETMIAPTIESLALNEKSFSECFAGATLPVLLWLGEARISGSFPSMGKLKDYLQSQNLPTMEELRKTDVFKWEDVTIQRIQEFRGRADKSSTAAEKIALDQAVRERRIMGGLLNPETPQEKALPHFFLTSAQGRDFSYRIEAGKKILSVPEPRPYTYRINIPDYPGELREVILNRLVKKFWGNPLFKKHGFQAKILGYTKTDGLILYMGDETIDEALHTVLDDALCHRYGHGEPARFGQVIDPRIPGMTVTTEPKNKEGETAGTFGDVISDLLATALPQAMKQSATNPESLIQSMLEHDHGQWVVDVLEPVFTTRARERFGEKLYLHNLAFLDKGHT